mgnify:CR=1 FL=1
MLACFLGFAWFVLKAFSITWVTIELTELIGTYPPHAAVQPPTPSKQLWRSPQNILVQHPPHPRCVVLVARCRTPVMLRCLGSVCEALAVQAVRRQTQLVHQGPLNSGHETCVWGASTGTLSSSNHQKPRTMPTRRVRACVRTCSTVIVRAGTGVRLKK